MKLTGDVAVLEQTGESFVATAEARGVPVDQVMTPKASDSKLEVIIKAIGPRLAPSGLRSPAGQSPRNRALGEILFRFSLLSSRRSFKSIGVLRVILASSPCVSNPEKTQYRITIPTCCKNLFL